MDYTPANEWPEQTVDNQFPRPPGVVEMEKSAIDFRVPKQANMTFARLLELAVVAPQDGPDSDRDEWSNRSPMRGGLSQKSQIDEELVEMLFGPMSE